MSFNFLKENPAVEKNVVNNYHGKAGIAGVADAPTITAAALFSDSPFGCSHQGSQQQ